MDKQTIPMPRGYGEDRSGGDTIDRRSRALPSHFDGGPRLLEAALRRAGPMYVADSEGRLIVTNPAFDVLLAAGFGGGPRGGPDIAPAALRDIFRRIEAGEDGIVSDDTWVVDGVRRRFRSSHFAVDDVGDGIGFAGQYIEIEPGGPTIEGLPQAAATHAAAAVKNAFLGKMSHEMRTPLNAIIGFTEMTQSEPFGPLDRRYVAYLRNIGNAARHLSGMIGDLLELAGATAEPTEGSVASADLGEALVAARAAVSDVAQRRNIDLAGIDTGCGWRVAADGERLHRICVNLLDNAIKFTGEGGRVGVEAAPSAVPGMIDIVFWDTGIGIPPDRHDRIFESFQEVDPDTLHLPTNGAGLGLAVSRHLARLMGGDLRVDSAPGEGARFTLRLPSREPGVAAAE